MVNTPRDALIAVAREAGAAAQRARAAGLAVSRKGSGEIVTSADRASHEVLAQRLAEHLPGVPLVSEEGDPGTLGSRPMLVADELDGTAPFAAGSRHWGVMLALLDREPTHGVIFLPDLGITIAAEKGRGCQLNVEPITLAAEAAPADLLLGAEINATMTPADWELLRRVSARFRAVRCMASAAASACELLTGITHAYLNVRGGKIWDFAAISLAVAEAKGTVTDPGGRALQWNGVPMSFLATSGPALLRQLSRDLPPSDPAGC